MQQIELALREDHVLFCPVTGEQVLFEDDFIPSKAMVFSYLEDEGGISICERLDSKSI
jgi:hypothetical protein